MSTSTTSDLGTNWAGNHTYRARALLTPGSVEELQEVVAGADRVRALGSRHSFSDLTDTDGVLVDLSGLPREVAVDADRLTVTVGGGVRYGDLAVALEREGWALANLASLPHISVAGAIATGTHGSGDRNQSLSAAVASLDLVGPDGALRTVRRGDADFAGSVVALGALGVVAGLELDVVPTYLLRQEVRTGLRWAAVERDLDAITAAGYSVSMFTHLDDEEVAQLWVKSHADAPPLAEAVGLVGTVAAPGTRHMQRGVAVDAVTVQGGVPGPWLDRLPHFRMEHTPSNGVELQSEWFVGRPDAVAAIRAWREALAPYRGLVHVAEIRTVAADDLWLSGAYRRDTVGFHTTWRRDEPAVRAACRAVEAALAPYAARPHWGKVFETPREELLRVHPRLRDFAELRERVDPGHVFGNAFLDRVLPDAS